MTDRLRDAWDVDDLDASEKRFGAMLETVSGIDRAEVLNQLARSGGLRGDFETGERLIDEAEPFAGDSDTARARIDLERGRLRRSSA